MEPFEEYLLNLPRYGDLGRKAMHPGLERVWALTTAMGDPHRQFKSIHIAGTNGKGSTASMTTAILRAAGLARVGLYTSPHISSMRERIRCDGQPVPASWMSAAVVRYQQVMDRVQPSFFEALTALAFLYFAEQRVSIAVVEAGLGGRLDATNILTPLLSIITGIDYDHTNVLGTTLHAIAREKGGIIKPEVPLLTATHQPGALLELETIAQRHQAPVHVTHRECQVEYMAGLLHAKTPQATYAGLSMHLAGEHQATNALLAIRAAELLNKASQAAVHVGLQRVYALSGLRGRLETLARSPRIILDVAHNEAGLRAALSYARKRCTNRLFVLFGLIRSKDIERMAQAFFASRAFVYACNIPARRGFSADTLASVLRSWSVPVPLSGSVAVALAHVREHITKDDVVLVCGSHYLAGTFLKAYS